jgi:hypothetical protein
LINERWVTEGADGHTLRGRRPRFLHLNKERLASRIHWPAATTLPRRSRNT